MPKGSKKRKADKKKKEKASNAQSPTNCQGNDDPKSHDEKDSDGGELGSPLSQDNPTSNHALVVEGERMEQEKRDSSYVEDNKSKEGSENGGADGNQKVEPVVVKVIEVVSDSKRDENGDSNGKGVDVVEFVKESLDGGSSGYAGTSGISSSSDEESRRVERTNQVTELGKFEKQKGAPDTTEAVPSICSAAPVVAEVVTSQVIEITGASDVIESETVEAVVENSGVVDVVEITSKVGEEKTLPSSDEKAAALSVCNLVSVGDEDKIFPVSDENAMASSGSNMVSVDKAMQLPKENDVVDGVTELRLAGNENKMIWSLEENTRTSSGMAGEDKILPVSDKHAMASSGSDMVSVGTEDKSMQLPKENEVVEGVTELRSAGNENKNNLLNSSGAPGVETSNVREHGKDTTISESSESQPLIASAPQIVKRTSWTNCCGLFDVLMGSNR